MFIASDKPSDVPCDHGALTAPPVAWLMRLKHDSGLRTGAAGKRETTERGNDGRGIEHLRTGRTGAAPGGGRRAVGISRRRVRHRRRRGAGSGVLRVFSARRGAARCADAAVHRHVAGHHHSDLDPVLSRPSRPRRGGHGNPAFLVAAGADRRRAGQRDRALRAGPAVQDRVPGGGLFGFGAAVAGAREPGSSATTCRRGR